MLKPTPSTSEGIFFASLCFFLLRTSEGYCIYIVSGGGANSSQPGGLQALDNGAAKKTAPNTKTAPAGG